MRWTANPGRAYVLVDDEVRIFEPAGELDLTGDERVELASHRQTVTTAFNGYSASVPTP
jgi:hypothetical protein